MGSFVGDEVNRTVARNVQNLRAARGHSVRSLSGRLQNHGCTIHPSGITKIEQGVRAVRVDELAVLAMVLGVKTADMLEPLQVRTAITIEKAVRS